MEIVLREHLDSSDAKAVYDLYESAWPEENRTVDEVNSIIQGSDISMGMYDENTETLVGFVRILTDFTAKALLCDFVIGERYRGKGLGGQLVEAARDHPQLTGVDTVELYCRDSLIQFYEQYGFTADVDMRLMRLDPNLS